MAYTVLVLVGILSLIPSPDIGTGDKLLHFITYFGLSVGFSTLVQQHRKLIFVVAGLIAFGILIEYLQGLTGYRDMDVIDMLANSAGVTGGLLIRLTPVPELFRLIEQRF